MSQETPDFSEDEQILGVLSDPLDVEAFGNLMAHAHDQGMSAADFVREEPKRTSRRAIQKLCLRNRKRSLRLQVSSVLKNLWERPAENPETAFAQSLYGPLAKPPPSGKNGQQKGT
jgi:hypothetical protein